MGTVIVFEKKFDAPKLFWKETVWNFAYTDDRIDTSCYLLLVPCSFWSSLGYWLPVAKEQCQGAWRHERQPQNGEMPMCVRFSVTKRRLWPQVCPDRDRNPSALFLHLCRPCAQLDARGKLMFCCPMESPIRMCQFNQRL